jgi:hypothetical protein
LEEKRREVLAAEEAMLRVGKEAERMSASNKLLADASISVGKAQEEVEGARNEIRGYIELLASMNKRTEELIHSSNSRQEAVESRLRGIDLEITAIRKSADELDDTIKKLATNISEMRTRQERIELRLKMIYFGLLVVLGISVLGIIFNFI